MSQSAGSKAFQEKSKLGSYNDSPLLQKYLEVVRHACDHYVHERSRELPASA